ncbi:hypothetical protein K8R43_01255 [archaeon]|nr:hypothetical protein [archaeon]
MAQIGKAGRVTPLKHEKKRPRGKEAGLFIILLLFLAIIVFAAFYYLNHNLILLIGGLIILFILLSRSSGFVLELTQYERAVILRYGKFKRVAGPGWIVLIPFIDDPHVVDTRTFTSNILPQKVITKDNVVLTVDAITFLKINDPEAAVLNIEEPELAVRTYVEAHLRDIIGKMELESVIGQVDLVNRLLKKGLEDVSRDWGITVVKVEIQSITLPQEVRDAMHQRKAAEQQKYAAEEQAQAHAIKITAVREAAGKLTDPALQYLYLQALEKIAEGKSSKIIFPLELTSLAAKLSNRVGGSMEATEDDLRKKYDQLMLEKTRVGGKVKQDDIINELRKRNKKGKK